MFMDYKTVCTVSVCQGLRQILLTVCDETIYLETKKNDNPLKKQMSFDASKSRSCSIASRCETFLQFEYFVLNIVFSYKITKYDDDCVTILVGNRTIVT